MLYDRREEGRGASFAERKEKKVRRMALPSTNKIKWLIKKKTMLNHPSKIPWMTSWLRPSVSAFVFEKCTCMYVYMYIHT